jgi:hypothetical protein
MLKNSGYGSTHLLFSNVFLLLERERDGKKEEQQVEGKEKIDRNSA